jgi:hypothetical protein
MVNTTSNKIEKLGDQTYKRVQANALETGSWDSLKELRMDRWIQKALKLAKCCGE